MKTVKFDLARAKNLPHLVATADGRTAKIIEFNLRTGDAEPWLVVIVPSRDYKDQDALLYYDQKGKQSTSADQLSCVVGDPSKFTRPQMDVEAKRLADVLRNLPRTRSTEELAAHIGKDDAEYVEAVIDRGVKDMVYHIIDGFMGAGPGMRMRSPSHPLSDLINDLRRA